MESRTGRLLLSLALAALPALPAHADEAGPADADAAAPAVELPLLLDGSASAEDTAPLIDPAPAQRRVREAGIDTENIEAGLYAGILSIEDFGSSALAGVQLGYHFTEDLFLQAHAFQAEGGITSYEQLAGTVRLLTPSEREYVGYDLSVGYNLFPGEAFIGRGRAYNTAFYLLAGIGSTRFGGDDRFTLGIGVGYRLLITDGLAWHIGYRDHLFASDILGAEKNTNNIELYSGLTTFF